MVRTAGNLSTGEKLLSIIDDIELVSKEIIENAIAVKQHQKMCGVEQVQLTELLVMKDNELKETLKVAEEQASIESRMYAVQAEVDKLDQDIQQLQRQLKEAEQIMATAIYQAKQKLKSMQRANKHPVASEDLIKFAHRISASNSICAPLSWAPGDPRRPYPTDIEMRHGLVGRLMSEMPVNGHMMQPASTPLQDMQRVSAPTPTSVPPSVPPQEPPASQQNQFAWHPSGEMHMSVGQGTVAMDTRKDKEDVEVMSSDSSSSSSSDSQ